LLAVDAPSDPRRRSGCELFFRTVAVMLFPPLFVEVRGPMVRTGTRFWLPPLLGALMLASCASYYRLEFGGDKAEQVSSVFLIVADANPFDKNSEDVSSLIRPDKVGEYLLFAQYDPVEGNPLRWKEESRNARSDLMKVELSSDARTVTLRIDKSLLEAYSQLTVVAVGHGADRWYAESVDPGEVRLGNGIRLDVGTAKFVRRQL
jgi:hypothetical protein